MNTFFTATASGKITVRVVVFQKSHFQFLFHRNYFWQLSRDRNLHGSGMSHTTTSSPEPSFRAPRREADAVVGRGNAGCTTSKSGYICPCQNCSQGSPADKTGRGFLLNHPSRPPRQPNQSRDWTELNRDWCPSSTFRTAVEPCLKRCLMTVPWLANWTCKLLCTTKLTMYSDEEKTWPRFGKGTKDTSQSDFMLY